jgi:hypothetical protein
MASSRAPRLAPFHPATGRVALCYPEILTTFSEDIRPSLILMPSVPLFISQWFHLV